MAVTYSPATKAARMAATRDYFAGGRLEIASDSGTVLACFYLSAKGGEVRGEVWNMTFESTEVVAEASGVPASAYIKTAGGEIGLTGLQVGKGKDIALTLSRGSEIQAGQDVKLSAAALFHA